jgi:uncharacterized protein (TIGR03083 family)
MQLNHEHFEDLVGAYALDACDEDETAALDVYVAEHPDAYAEVERLRGAAAWLGASGLLVPPPDLRTSVLGRARVAPASGAEAYQELTDAFEAELATFRDEAAETTTYNGLSVRELVAHLTAIDRMFRDEITMPTPGGRPWPDEADVHQITDRELTAVGDASLAAVAAEWDATRRELLDVAANAPADGTVMGYDINDALLIRTFETWTHLDDVRRTRATDGYVPTASVLRSVGDLSMRVVPFTLLATNRSHAGRSARIVLTGPGGRAWTVPLAAGEEPAGEPDVEITVGMLEWCHRFSNRLEADAVPMDVAGDLDLARDVIAAAPVFTRL